MSVFKPKYISFDCYGTLIYFEMAPMAQKLFADRIGGVNYGKGTEIYKFEKIKRAKRSALEQFPDRTLIDFGIGENDNMAPANVRSRMESEISDIENRGYADNGIHEHQQPP